MNDASPQHGWIGAVRWTSDGLVPCIVQDVESNDVLMMAWMDREALRLTLESGQTHFYSRSRKALWHKGATSGHVQFVEELRVDCDADVLLVRVRQVGGACHEGYRSCFFRRLNEAGELETTAEPVFAPESVYRSKSAGPTGADEERRVLVPSPLEGEG